MAIRAAQGAPLAPSVSLNDDAVVDIVFADNDWDGLGLDIALNGQGRASLGYEIGTRNVALSVTKSQLVMSDPINLLVARRRSRARSCNIAWSSTTRRCGPPAPTSR